MASGGQTYSVDKIKDLLLADIDRVAHHYAPPVGGHYYDKGGYWTCNPGRMDRRPGSFVIWLSGHRAGRWFDFAMDEGGDLVDLIRLSLNSDLATAFKEARAWLGLETETPELRRKRDEAIRKSRERRKRAEAERRDEVARIRGAAQRLWLASQERIKGTPAELYLRDRRGIDLSRLGHQPNALRYHPECWYSHVDEETGEVIEGKFPAILAVISNGHGETVGVHRIYLQIGPDGRWNKAQVPVARKALGEYWGGSVRLWRGTEAGPRGGKPPALSKCPPGTRVYISEGIEDALSGILAVPEGRWLSAISLGNMGEVHLPKNVSEVVLAADRDTSPDARAALKRAIAKHQQAGRTVRLWQNKHGGKDLNDALLTFNEGAA